MFTLNQLIHITNGKLLQGDLNVHIPSFHFNSKKIQKDACFIALTKGVRDGHEFLQDALEKGAQAAIISNSSIALDSLGQLALILVPDTEQALQQIALAYRQQLHLPMIAITGSNGKTTTKDMVAHLLETRKKVYKTQGNLNNHLGAPLSLLQIEESHEAAVLELGMNHAGEIDLLAGIVKPTISVITNIGDAHLEFFGSKHAIAKAKGEILPHTDPSSYVLLNKDDPFVCSQADRYPGIIYYYSVKEHADVFATDLLFTDKGTSFRLHIGDQSTSCFMPMYGEHNVSNVLPAAFIAYQFGFTLEQIASAMLSLAISAMRFQIIDGPKQSLLINDAYNASPTSMRASIHTFRQIYPNRKKVVVLGDIYELGDESKTLHQSVGKYIQDLKKKQELVVVTIGEHSQWISKECEGTHFSTKEEAIKALQPYLSKEYALLFKASRGMMLEDVINGLLLSQEA